MDINLTEILVAVISGVFSYLAGHRRGRAVYRSGDNVGRPRDLLK